MTARQNSGIPTRPLGIGLLTSYLALDQETDSGIGQHFRVLADALVAQGQRVHVVHPTLKPAIAQAALAALNPAWTCEIAPVHPPQLWVRILQRSWPAQMLLADIVASRVAARVLDAAAKTHGLHVVESHATGTPARAYLKRRTRLPVAIRVSTSAAQLQQNLGTVSRFLRWQARLEQAVTRRADGLITHTLLHRDTLCATEGYARDSFTIIPHGLPDIRRSGASPSRAPPSTAVEALYVGRFELRKGTDVLLAAIPQIAAHCPHVHFTLAGSFGDGALWREFSARHAELAGTRVTALGRVCTADLEALYARCDFLVAPSRYESFGLVYLEAMRHGKPVIGCRAGGVPEVVRDEVTGVLVPPGDVAALAAAVQRLAGDQSLRLALGEAGRADFGQRFSATRLAEESIAFYRQLCARSCSEEPRR